MVIVIQHFLQWENFNGHLSLIFAINFKIMAAQSFRNYILSSSLTFKFAKADVTAEPSSTLSMSERFSLFPKSSCKYRQVEFSSETTSLFANIDVNCLKITSRSTARKEIIGLLVFVSE